MMKKYVVIADFADLNDGKHFYKAGDTFPREGAKADKKRFAELCGVNNKARKPLIKEVEDDTDGGMSGNKKLVRPKSE